jgi:peptide-methionine (S)-S-oxide reductase
MFGLFATTRIVKLAAVAALLFTTIGTARAGSVFPNNQMDAPPGTTGNAQIAVFAGGCFWGVDAVFKHVKGVSEVESGYAGGRANTAKYDEVSGGDTGHAEAVRVRFDPSQVSYQQLLQVFFGVAHDPTQLNRQGPDVGSQYRSAIFYTSADQEKIAKAYVQQMTGAHTFSKPIVTQIVPLQQFYRAEEYHQNYLALHPYQPYIVFNDMPKLEQLRKQLPILYR